MVRCLIGLIISKNSSYKCVLIINLQKSKRFVQFFTYDKRLTFYNIIILIKSVLFNKDKKTITIIYF